MGCPDPQPPQALTRFNFSANESLAGNSAAARSARLCEATLTIKGNANGDCVVGALDVQFMRSKPKNQIPNT